MVGTLHLLLPRSWFTTNLVSSKVLWSLQKRWQDHILLLLANGAASISGCSPVAKINLVFLRPFKWSRPYQRTPSHWPGQSSTTTSTTHFDDRQRANVAGFVFPVFALISVSFLFSTLVFLCKFRCVFLPLYALCPAPHGMIFPTYQMTPSFSSATASCLFGGSNFRLNIFNCRPSLCSRAQCLQSYKKILSFIQQLYPHQLLDAYFFMMHT